MHFCSSNSAPLHHPLLDSDGGYFITPMSRGIRLTTGVEFAPRDRLPSPFQVDRSEALAREILSLGQRVEPEPWMGSRPCLPDMRPIIGATAREKRLWFAFGHNHLGLTLGPVTGRLLAEMMTGEETFTDPTPFAADRFDRH